MSSISAEILTGEGFDAEFLAQEAVLANYSHLSQFSEVATRMIHLESDWLTMRRSSLLSSQGSQTVGAVFDWERATIIDDGLDMTARRRELARTLYFEIIKALEVGHAYELAVNHAYHDTADEVATTGYPVPSTKGKLLSLLDDLEFAYQSEPGIHFQDLANGQRTA